MEFVYLIQNKGHRDVTELSKILRKFKGDDVFHGCVVFISTVSRSNIHSMQCVFSFEPVCIKCVSHKAKHNYLTKSENAVSV